MHFVSFLSLFPLSSSPSAGVWLQQGFLREDDSRSLPNQVQVRHGRTGPRPVVQLAGHHGVSSLGHAKSVGEAIKKITKRMKKQLYLHIYGQMIELDLAEKALFSNLLIKTNMLLPKIPKIIKKLQQVASRVTRCKPTVTSPIGL